jgi:LysM repeat protein
VADVNKIEVGQELWIPLPCSCDDVDGVKVVHYGHLVDAGSTVEGIAEQYGTTAATLLSLNQMANASDLKASQVLDVPLKGSFFAFLKIIKIRDKGSFFAFLKIIKI